MREREMAGFDPKAEGFERFLWRGTAGVYLLFQGEELVYVGQSVNVPRRIASHLQAMNPKRRRFTTKLWLTPNDIRGMEIRFDRVDVKWCEQKELDVIERELIQRLKPKHNDRVNWSPPKPLPEVDIDLAEIGLGHLVHKPIPSSVARRLVL